MKPSTQPRRIDTKKAPVLRNQRAEDPSDEPEAEAAEASWNELEELTAQTGNAVDTVLYSDRKGLKPYRIIKPSPEKIAEWKAQIDEFVAAITSKNLLHLLTIMRKDGRKKGDYETLANMLQNEKMDQKDIILWAIGLFALREKSSWHAVKNRMKLLQGGDVPMESFFEKDGRANCYDISVFAKTMAAEYGIEGEVVGRWIWHAKFITTDKKICDVLAGWERGGLFQSESKYREFLESKREKHPLARRS